METANPFKHADQDGKIVKSFKIRLFRDDAVYDGVGVKGHLVVEIQFVIESR